MVRRSELVAAFSAGAAPSVVLKPVLAIGIVLALLFALDVELLVPPSYPMVNAIRRQLELSESPLDDPGRQTWFKGAQQLYHVQSLLGEGGRVLGGVMMLSVSDGRLVERWDADRLHYEDGAWIGQGVLHRAPKGEATLLTERFESHRVPISEVPDDFVNGIAPPASLRFSDLARVTRARERLGSPALAHRVELYQRFTGPPVLLLLIAVAAGLALRLPRKHSMAVALGIGAAIGFLGWYLREFERLFAAMGNVSPLWAAALVPALLGAITVWAWLRVARDGIVEG
jgi:lipopolysaccharide export LptBFGC system permease protein LptF